MEASEVPASSTRLVGEPGVEEARAALVAARSVATRGGRAARGNVSRAALAVWGLVWLVHPGWNGKGQPIGQRRDNVPRREPGLRERIAPEEA